MPKKLLAVIAHPDDESFGIGGTLAKYAKEGVDIHVLCATRGENGQGGSELGKIREKELLTASKILGVKEVEFMGYVDGLLSNSLYHDMATKIENKIQAFQPQAVLTFDQLGITGHIDHIAVSLVTTFVCKKYQETLPLFYFCELKEVLQELKDYFIYVPDGYTVDETDVCIDITNVWETKVQAMWAHASQKNDVKMILDFKKAAPKHEYFRQAFKATHGGKLAPNFFSS